MANRITRRDMVMLMVLALLLIGVLYYMLFYTPLQDEMTSIATQAAEVDDQTNLAMTKVQKMKLMQEELDAILSQPKDKITEIAPYDNAKVVMSQLNNILSVTENYNLSFKDPAVNDDGTVRREVSMKFECGNYYSAKKIIQDLSSSRWRCLINSFSINAMEGTTADADGTAVYQAADAMSGPVSVDATITFFESTQIK